MSFPRYPKYKPSGVEWLGDVPAHWSVQKLKSIARFSGGGTPSRDTPAFWNGDIPWVSPKDMKVEDISEAEESITPAGVAASATKLVAPNHLLMVVRSGILQHTIPVAINSRAVALNQDMKALNFGPAKWMPKFFMRWIQGLNERLLLAWAKQGATVESIEHAYLADSLVPVPPDDEQAGIVVFLDAQIERIDALVAEQERLIELLKEKRQAVISHAVTKGLNPNAPMKDSGIEWLGQIPAHWEMKRLKHVSPNIVVGIVVNPSSYISDEGVPFIYGGDIREGAIDWFNARRIPPALSAEQSKTTLNAGDVLTVRVGAPGVTAVVPPECEGGNCASVVLIRRGDFNSHWLSFLMNTRVVRFQVEVVQYGAAQEQFNVAHAMEFWLPVPPRDEQDAIAHAVALRASQIGSLLVEAERCVALLNERRAALISAAVTGQIDVRPESQRTAA